ncbi:MAG: hypothetical protein HGA55_07125 [Methanoregulaceae archaeon]|jgi:hypothetical protein|nr:hypothetical protein [Methanoregulaceae archaeon]
MRAITFFLIAMMTAGLAISPCLAAPAGMSVMGAGAGGVSQGRTALISDYSKLTSISKQPAIAGYGPALKPDITVFTRDTTIYADPALLASWQQSEGTVTPSRFAGSYGVFAPRRSSSCGCGC